MNAIPAFLLLTTLTWPAFSQVPAQPAEKLPREARVLLDRTYKEWRFAPVKTEGNCIDRMGPSPSQLSADFDQDGFNDLALQIQTAEGTRLVVLMRRLDSYQLYEVDRSNARTADRFLGVEKRGTAFISPASGGKEVLANDTLMTRSCGSGRIIYVWLGAKFDRIVLPI